MRDPFDLQRFVDAQTPVLAHVHAELAAGAKRSHWMWFVFPQLRGLGHSDMAHHYGIGSLAEAKAYWQHAVLGPRLRACAELLVALPARTAEQVFGTVDASKLRSCLTLFERASPGEPLFPCLLERFFGGERDAATLSWLARPSDRQLDGGSR